jgi:hypothetical protein
MADDDKMKRAAEIDAAVKKADAEKKADADTEAGPTLADIMSAVKACSDAMTSMGARMDAIEAAGKGGDKDGDDLVDEGKARQAAVDARKRADGADTPEMRQQRRCALMQSARPGAKGRRLRCISSR